MLQEAGVYYTRDLSEARIAGFARMRYYCVPLRFAGHEPIDRFVFCNPGDLPTLLNHWNRDTDWKYHTDCHRHYAEYPLSR